MATPLTTAAPAHAECNRVEVAYSALGSPEKVLVDDARCVGPLREDYLVDYGHSAGHGSVGYVRVYFMLIEPPVAPPPPPLP